MVDKVDMDSTHSSPVSVKEIVAQNVVLDLPRGCSLITVPNVKDERGELCFVDGFDKIPFDVKRVFWIHNITPGAVRGNHANKCCYEVLFPVSGEVSVELDDGCRAVVLRLDKPNTGVLIPPLVWSRQFDYTDHSACLCLVSTLYEPNDYIYNYDEFLKEVNG